MKFAKKILLFILCWTLGSLGVFAENFVPGTDIVGYGYDIFGEYANQKSLKRYNLFEYKEFSTKRIGSTEYVRPREVYLENISEHKVKTISGESMREYAMSLSAAAGLSVDALVFSASVNSTYDFSASKTEHKFYYTYMDSNTKWRVSLDTRNFDKLKNLLEPQFKHDIDKMNPIELFETYGTHYVASAYIGGRADYTSVSTVTGSTKTKDISIAVEAKYKAVSGSQSLSKSQSQTLSNSKTETNLKVIGGNSEYANDINDNTKYEKWADGIAEMPVLCDFDEDSLRPIWDFASTSSRKNELEVAFKKMLSKYPLPEGIANSIKMQNKVFYIKNKDTELYWDLSGYHFDAEKKRGKVGLHQKDNGLNKGMQGADRFIKIISHPVETDYVFLQPQHSDYVVDISGGVETPGAELQLWNYGKSNSAQMFKLIEVKGEKNTYYIQNKNSELYLTANKGEAITQEKKMNSNSQKWVFETADAKVEMAPPTAGKFAIQNVKAKRYLDIPGSAPKQEGKGASVNLWDMDYNPDRYFLFKAMKGEKEYFAIQPMYSENVFDIKDASKKNAADLRVWERNDTSAQLFKFVYAGSPMTYYIYNKNSGKVLDASEKNINRNGCPVFQYSYHGGDNQKWKLHTAPMWSLPPKNQKFFIKTAYSKKYLDLPGGGKETDKNGKEFVIWDFDNGGDRKFKIIPTGSHSWINIQVQNGGKYMTIPNNSNKKREHVVLNKKSSGKDQMFAIMPTSPTTFVIRTKNWKALDVEGAKFENGTKLIQWSTHYGKSQQFKLIYADGPSKGKAFKFF